MSRRCLWLRWIERRRWRRGGARNRRRRHRAGEWLKRYGWRWRRRRRAHGERHEGIEDRGCWRRGWRRGWRCGLLRVGRRRQRAGSELLHHGHVELLLLLLVPQPLLILCRIDGWRSGEAHHRRQGRCCWRHHAWHRHRHGHGHRRHDAWLLLLLLLHHGQHHHHLLLLHLKEGGIGHRALLRHGDDDGMQSLVVSMQWMHND